MSFSSTSSLPSCDLSTAISSTSSPPSTPNPTPSKPTSSPSPTAPDYKRLERILLSLIHLARTTYSPRSCTTTPNAYYHARTYDQYTRILARLTSFFQTPAHRDSKVWIESGTWGYVFEMGVLLRLVESALGVGHVLVEGMGGGGAEVEERLQVERRVNLDVEFLVFRGAELDCERLPWNVGAV